VSGACLLTGLCLALCVRAAAPAPQIHIHIFLSSTCPHCQSVEKPALDSLAAKLGCTIVPHYHDVDSMDEYKRLVALERRLGDTGNDLPVVALGDGHGGGRILGGNKEIEAGLPALLKQHAATGLPDVTVPTVAEADAMLRAGTAGPAGAMRLAYFEQPGCRECARVDRMLKLAAERHPGIQVRRFAMTSREDRVLLEALCGRAAVEEGRRLLVPAVFVGKKALVQGDITDESLDALLASGEAGATVWEVSAAERAAAAQRLWERSRAVSLAAVTIGGLADGVNPCAFATIVFLVCCLAGMGQGRGRILAVGAAFTCGVFLAYLVMGVGLGELLQGLDALPALSRAVSAVIVAAVFVLAALSFRDWVMALRNRPKAMALKLPQRLRLRINAQISRSLHAPWLAAGAFGLGGTVSLLEFVCTGQVYFPLIRYMTAVSDTRLRALGLLVVYDVAFVVPLIVVFMAAYLGLSSERLQEFFKRHLAFGKLLLGVFFLGLGILLLRIEFGPL
jgi:glutaredoxin